MRRFIVSFACAVGLLAAVPVVASAWTASVSSGTLDVNGGAALDDGFTITDIGSSIRVSNTLTGAVAGAGCTFISTTTVDCLEAGIQRLDVFGDSGNDEIAILGSSIGFNTLTCCNVLSGGSGNDEISGHPGVAMDETIDGGIGEDVLEGGLGADVFIGGSGIGDTVSYADFNPATGTSRHEDVRVSIGDGPNDGSLRDGPIDARDDVQAGVEILIGANGDDVLIGDPAVNRLDGSAGDDLLRGGDHLDDLNGGSGNDVLRGGATEDALDGGNGDDLLRGDDASDVLDGGGGNDTLNGGDANDTLDGGLDADLLIGGPSANAGDTVTYAARTTAVNVTIGTGGSDDGNSQDGITGERDTVRGDVENVTGGSAGDVLTGSEVNNTFLGGDGADVITGLAGIDTMSYADHTAGVTVVIDANAVDGNAADGSSVRDLVKTDVEDLIGTAFADSLKGSALANEIDGGLGADSLFGNNGNDFLIADDGVADTVLNCGGGTADVLDLDAGLDPAPVGCESVF